MDRQSFNGLACMIFLCLFLTAPLIVKAQVSNQTFEVPMALVIELEDWIDRNTDLPRAPVKAEIRMAEIGSYDEEDMLQSRPGQHLKALYEGDQNLITLMEPWDPQNLLDKSVLLHELVHHRQEHAKHWYCLQSREHPAYLAQEAWLNDQGLSGNFFWLGIILDSSCTKRDVHP